MSNSRLAFLFLTASAVLSFAQTTPIQETTNQFITPTAGPGSTFQTLATGLRPDTNADGAEAVSSALSPDGNTLLILRSGYNTGYNTGFNTVSGTRILYPVLDPVTGQPTGKRTANAEWVFVYDLSGPTPVQKQKLNIPLTYCGLVWDPSGSRFYVSGDSGDMVYVFKNARGSFVPDFPWIVLNTRQQLANAPAGPALNSLGRYRRVGKVFVSSQRDAEVMIFDNSGNVRSVPVKGGPNKMILSKDGETLFVANGEDDSISVVDTASELVTANISLLRAVAQPHDGNWWAAIPYPTYRSGKDLGVSRSQLLAATAAATK